ncbi:MAG: cytidylate kinase-like family protein [Roseburia sp.]|nr:cytidylate kinase-like family protein [Roseburia sp.]MCM1098232.1 cytidylate kinase-like family protein [Ruminococcus flavefaciens]
MKIVTISREFGSGGRELGKRLVKKPMPSWREEMLILSCKVCSLTV